MYLHAILLMECLFCFICRISKISIGLLADWSVLLLLLLLLTTRSQAYKKPAVELCMYFYKADAHLGAQSHDTGLKHAHAGWKDALCELLMFQHTLSPWAQESLQGRLA